MINKTNLPIIAAEHLKDRIVRGEYNDILPSERRLCRDLRLSRTTIRTAISILSKQGYLATSQGKATRILKPENSNYNRQEDCPKKVVVLSPTPLEKQRPYNVLWVDALRSSLHDAGFSLEVRAENRLSTAKNTSLLRKIVQETKSACWVLLHSTDRIQNWFQNQNIPCVVAGNCNENVFLPRVSIDFHALTSYALQRMKNAGCRNIVILIETSQSPGSNIIENSIVFAKSNPFFKDSEIEIIHVHSDRIEEVTRAIHRLRLKDNKQGIFVPNPLLCITAISESLLCGMNVNKLYVTTSFFESLLQYLRPTPSSFEFNHKLFARKVHSKIMQIVSKSPIRNPESLIVPNYIKGDF